MSMTETMSHADIQSIKFPSSYWLQAGRSGDRIPVGARFSAPVQTGPVAHPPSCTMGTGSFPGQRVARM